MRIKYFVLVLFSYLCGITNKIIKTIMKRYLLTILAVFALTFTTKAQTHHFGINGAVSISSINAPANTATNKKLVYKLAGFGGLSYDLLFKKNLLFGTGVEYVGLGSSLRSLSSLIYDSNGNLLTDQNGDPIQGSSKHHNQLDFISIPLKFGFQTDGKFFAIGRFGFVGSFLVNQTQNTTLYHASGSIMFEHKSQVFTNLTTITLDALAEIGLGYRFKSLVFYSSLQFRHNLTTVGGSRYYAFIFTTGLKYCFNLKKKPNSQD